MNFRSLDFMCKDVLNNLNNRDGEALSEILQEEFQKRKYIKQVIKTVGKGNKGEKKKYEDYIAGVFEKVFRNNAKYEDCVLPFWHHFVRSMLWVQIGMISDSFQEMVIAAEQLLSWLNSEKNQAFLVPVFKVFIVVYRKVGQLANDYESEAGDEAMQSGEFNSGDKSNDAFSNTCLDKVSNWLQSVMRKCMMDRSEEHCLKQGLTLNVINQMLKIYFRSNNLSLCNSVIGTVTNSEAIDFDKFPISQQVSFQFYAGRYYVFVGKLNESIERLQFAFDHCHCDKQKNKKCILQYLICVKMLLNKYPTNKLLKKYNIVEFIEIIKACKYGDIELFESEINENQEYFIERGIWLLLEKAKFVLYRNLLRKICKVYQSSNPKNPTRIPLSIVKFGFEIKLGGNEKMDYDEVECILATLIATKKIGGYISHEQKLFVIAKKFDVSFPKFVVLYLTFYVFFLHLLF